MSIPDLGGVPRRVVVAAAIILVASGGATALLARSLLGSDAAQIAYNVGLRQEIRSAGRVPFLGPFSANKRFGTVCGPGVRLMEGALRRTTPPVRVGVARNCVGLATVRELIKFQVRHHIPPSGIYGRLTHDALSHAYSPEQRRALVYLEAKRLAARAAALHRRTIGIVTAHAYAFRYRMGYCNHGALRDCSLRGVWPAWPDVPRNTDCSGYVQWVLFQSGVPNINGTSYPGNTTSLWQHGSLVSPVSKRLAVGDLVFYRPNNSHVAIYIGRGLVSSHGQAGIDIYPWNRIYVYGVRRYFASPA